MDDFSAVSKRLESIAGQFVQPDPNSKTLFSIEVLPKLKTQGTGHVYDAGQIFRHMLLSGMELQRW